MRTVSTDRDREKEQVFFLQLHGDDNRNKILVGLKHVLGPKKVKNIFVPTNAVSVPIMGVNSGYLPFGIAGAIVCGQTRF